LFRQMKSRTKIFVLTGLALCACFVGLILLSWHGDVQTVIIYASCFYLAILLLLHVSLKKWAILPMKYLSISIRPDSEIPFERRQHVVTDLITLQDLFTTVFKNRNELEIEISKRKRAEKALNEIEARISIITNSAQDAILMMNPQGKISYWNPAAERIFGYRSAEVIGQNLHELIAPTRFHEAHRAAFSIFRHTGNGDAIGKTLDLEARRNDGSEISVQLSLSAFHLNDGWNALGIIRDITARKRLERTAMESEKMAAVGLLAAGVAHEFNNLLGGIIGNLSLAIEHQDDMSLVRNCIEESISISEQAAALTQSLLASSSHKGDVMVKIDIIPILETIVKLVGKEIESRGIQLTKHYQDVPFAMGIAGQLHQVFLNLLINAIHAVKDKGKITIKVWQGNRKLYVEFADNGCGIKKEDLKNLFNPFYSTKGVWGDNQQQGTGLGLYISRNIIKHHGGDIEVQSIHGAGTQFTVLLPIVDSNSNTTSNEAYLAGMQALIIEPDEGQASIIFQTLRDKSVDIILCGSYAEAFDKVQLSKYDFIVADTSSPAIGDFARFMELIEHAQPTAPLFITYGKSLRHEYEALCYKKKGSIIKPFTKENIIDGLSVLIEDVCLQK
jgi:PAS domain S-box-containing protein